MRLLKLGLLFLMFRAAWSLEPTTAFEALKTLEGEWAITSEGKTLPIRMHYETGSKGSIISERFGKELSVFYREGQDLAMLHFCNAGNQPRLKLKRESESPAILTFETAAVSNLSNPEAPHVQRITYTIRNRTSFDLEIVWLKGRSQETERYTLDKM